MKYIQNLTKMKNNVQIEYNDPSGAEQFGKPERVKIDFRPETIDSFSGTLLHTGITSVSDEVYEALCKERNFTYAVGIKENWLKVHEELPDFAQTPNDIVVKQREDMARMAARIAELEATGGVAGQVTELTAVLNKVESEKAEMANQLEGASAELKDADETINAQAGKIDELNKELETTKVANKTLIESNERLSALVEVNEGLVAQIEDLKKQLKQKADKAAVT